MAEFDRRRFFDEIARFLRAWTSLFGRLAELRRTYAVGAAELGSIGFWREVYRPELSAAGRAGASAAPQVANAGEAVVPAMAEPLVTATAPGAGPR